MATSIWYGVSRTQSRAPGRTSFRPERFFGPEFASNDMLRHIKPQLFGDLSFDIGVCSHWDEQDLIDFRNHSTPSLSVGIFFHDGTSTARQHSGLKLTTFPGPRRFIKLHRRREQRRSIQASPRTSRGSVRRTAKLGTSMINISICSSG